MPPTFSPTVLLTLLLALLMCLTVEAGGASRADAAPPAVPLRLTEKGIHDATLHRIDNDTWEIRTTGNDPYLFTEAIPVPADLKHRHVLAFEYFSTTGAGAVQVFLDPPLSEARSVKGAPISRSEGWSRYAIDLNPARGKSAGKVRALRIDPGSEAGRVVRIRSLELRARTAQEERLAEQIVARRAAEKRRDQRLQQYLKRTLPCRIDWVAVDDTTVRISGTVDEAHASRGLFLAEIPIWDEVADDSAAFRTITPIRRNAAGQFDIALARHASDGAEAQTSRDRLLSRWVVAEKDGKRFYLLSHARYADTVKPRAADLPEEKPRNKKGIGGLAADRPLGDIAELGLSAATVNIVLNGLVSTIPGPGHSPFSYAGRTWYANDAQVTALDRTMRDAAKHRLMVSAIVLVGQGANAPEGSFSRRIAHPDADPAGIFVMPDVTSERGLTAYAAALEFLAERYSHKDGRHGRIHHWIMHNEINAAWVWTNAGEKSALRYMDLYVRSMRTAHLIARQYDPHAQAFISLEHHWNTAPQQGFYPGRDLMGKLSEFSRVEGDFEWGIAFHPYPQNLFDPRVWEDKEAEFSFATPKITFKNLEVLDAWVRLPHMLYEGKHPRTVHLSEQGLNSRDYGEVSLRDQAAGMAYAWNKFKDLETISVFHYHNWVDNRHEGGLRIGLRRFPDDTEEPLGRKPIWFVYQALGTEREAEITAPYKTVIGVREWGEVRHVAPIRGAQPPK